MRKRVTSSIFSSTYIDSVVGSVASIQELTVGIQSFERLFQRAQTVGIFPLPEAGRRGLCPAARPDRSGYGYRRGQPSSVRQT